MTEAKTQASCPRLNNCEAPLCLLAPNLPNQIWYPDEELCKAKRFHSTTWVKRQRQIQKVARSRDTYFSVAMLKVIRTVKPGIEGLDPDRALDEAKNAEEKWIIARGKKAVKQS